MLIITFHLNFFPICTYIQPIKLDFDYQKNAVPHFMSYVAILSRPKGFEYFVIVATHWYVELVYNMQQSNKFHYTKSFGSGLHLHLGIHYNNLAFEKIQFILMAYRRLNSWRTVHLNIEYNMLFAFMGIFKYNVYPSRCETVILFILYEYNLVVLQ